MRLARALCVAATAFASVASAQEPVRRDMAEYCQSTGGAPFMPTQALERRISGRVVLSCIITAERRLQTCEVAEETPTNIGFAEAAFRIACRYSPNEGGVAIAETLTATTDEFGVSRVRQPFIFNINR